MPRSFVVTWRQRCVRVAPHHLISTLGMNSHGFAFRTLSCLLLVLSRLGVMFRHLRAAGREVRAHSAAVTTLQPCQARRCRGSRNPYKQASSRVLIRVPRSTSLPYHHHPPARSSAESPPRSRHSASSPNHSRACSRIIPNHRPTHACARSKPRLCWTGTPLSLIHRITTDCSPARHQCPPSSAGASRRA